MIDNSPADNGHVTVEFTAPDNRIAVIKVTDTAAKPSIIMTENTIFHRGTALVIKHTPAYGIQAGTQVGVTVAYCKPVQNGCCIC